MDAQTQIAGLNTKLRHLEKLDRGPRWSRNEPQIFGAGSHRYARQVVRPDSIRAFESAFHVSVPSDLAAIWTEIGAGVGPYYGLCGPAQIQRELADWASEAEHGDESYDLLAPFPLHWPGDFNHARVLDGPTPGCLPISRHGDDMWSVLVINGDEAGHVWDFSKAGALTWEWIPAVRPPGTVDTRGMTRGPLSGPPSLFDWYSGWLDQAISSLS
jgi:hypothetical protein